MQGLALAGRGALADSEDDTSLVKAARHDLQAFAGMYRRYVPRVYRYLYSQVGNAVEAEDLTSQVFTAALEALPGLNGTTEAGKAAFAARYDAGRDRIVMYSLSTCGFCAEKRRQFDSMGVRYSEYIIDQDAAAEARLNDRLQRAAAPR